MLTSPFRTAVFLLPLALLGPAAGRAAEVDFAREVYPVLQKACFECHGTEKQKGHLRLDSLEAALKGGEGGPALVPGHAAESELLRRVSLPKGDDEVMPSRGDLLTKAEIGRLRAWIEAGAVWPAQVQPARHWSYVKPVRAPLPEGDAPHPIDRFIRATLAHEGLKPSPAADPHHIARRLYFDLTGLPPSPAEVDAFVNAARQNLQGAVESLADRLLASPQYGEKWARPWLDLARYADSHGFQRDDLRDLWPYRDWVIRALNADMPYDQFSIEQLAGDLLPSATEAQKIATGFNRCSPCNVEAGTDPEETRVNQVFDRVATLGAVWLGATLECAQCHDHKYDPITTREFYGLFSFFNQTEIEADRAKPQVLSSIKFIGPYMKVADPEKESRREELQAEIEKLQQSLTRRARGDSAGSATSEPPASEVLKPLEFDSLEGSTYDVLEDRSILLAGDPPATDTYTVTVRTSLKGITGFKLEALTDPSLPGMGPGRGDPQRTNFVLNTFSVTAAPARDESDAQPVVLRDARADFSQRNFDVSGAIDDDPKTAWAIMPRFHEPHWATFRTEKPIGFAGGTVLTFRLVQNYGQARTIGRLRLTALTGAQEAPLKEDREVARLKGQLSTLQGSLRKLGETRTLVMQETEEPRANMVFKRGDFRSPGDAAVPSTPAVLHPFREEGPRNRLALARWLVSRENPLAARVFVNRVWAELFGEGIVPTLEDFGIKGDAPSHPELLDWLALDFMEGGWSQKKLIREIVTSAAYLQDSRITPEGAERDPRNHLLARGPRFRLNAEEIRDNALSIAGLLDLKQFGPPIYPPQPAGLWAKVGGAKYEYTESEGADRNRRGIYVVLKRTSPYPSFINFDATSRMACRTRRPRSNTPLQALTLLNDPVYVETARAFAARILRDRPEDDPEARLRYAFQLAVARPPAPQELEILRDLYSTESATGANGEKAGWFAIATALLNLDETITKN